VSDDLERRLATLRRALGARRPNTVAQQAFDLDDGHLRRLVRLGPDRPAAPSDLSEYAEDLRYTPIDVPLLLHLLPVCLRALYAELVTPGSATAFSEAFYPVLADRGIFDGHLTSTQSAAAALFLRESILDAIDRQRGLTFVGILGNRRTYAWIEAWSTYAVLRPDLAELSHRWWSLDTIGRCVAFVQFASVLAYDDRHNPVFAPWTCDQGGGPPTLWEFSGHLYDHRWLDANVAWLRETLTVERVVEGVRRAAARLEAEAEGPIAARVLSDLPERRPMLARRCEELPLLLATRQTAGSHLEWTPS
jgi:hypothetical protein